MNISQLAQRIARHLDVPDAFNLSSSAALDVVNAINSGLQLFFTEAPSIYKRRTFSKIFKAPQSLEINFLSQYGTKVSGTPFEPSWLGCGIRASGMADDNEISGVDSVLDPWTLPNLNVQAQVLFDAQPIPATIERITSEVRACRVGHDSGMTTLDRDESIASRQRYLQMDQASAPKSYRIEPMAIVQGGSISSLLRIRPYPTVDTIVRFEAELSAASVTVQDLLVGTELPISGAWAPLLIPLCEDALTYSPLWRDPKTKGDIRQNASMTIAARIKKLPQDIAVPNNAVHTPRGF